MSKGIIDFQPFNEDESASYLADHWPIGKLTSKKYVKGSIVYKFIKSLASWILNFSGDLFSLVKNRDIDQAEELFFVFSRTTTAATLFRDNTRLANATRFVVFQPHVDATKCPHGKILTCSLHSKSH